MVTRPLWPTLQPRLPCSHEMCVRARWSNCAMLGQHTIPRMCAVMLLVKAQTGTNADASGGAVITGCLPMALCTLYHTWASLYDPRPALQAMRPWHPPPHFETCHTDKRGLFTSVRFSYHPCCTTLCTVGRVGYGATHRHVLL